LRQKNVLGYEENCSVMITMTIHEWPNQQIYAFIDYANWFFNKYHGTDYSRQSDLTPGPAQPLFSIDWVTDRLIDDAWNSVPVCTWYNPMAREDYLCLTWKNPNRTKQISHEYSGDGITKGRTIAENVRAYFRDHPEELVDKLGNPVVIDYPKELVPEGYSNKMRPFS